MVEVFKIAHYTIHTCHLNWNITRAVALEVININFLLTYFTMIYENTAFLYAFLTFGIAYKTVLSMLILLTSLKRAWTNSGCTGMLSTISQLT